jgi:hypothetical protein
MELILAAVYRDIRVDRRTVPATPMPPAETSMPPPEAPPLGTANQPDSLPLPDRRSFMALERRRADRYAIDTKVRGEVVSGAKPKPMYGRSCDLSQHGMALISPSDLNVDDILHITFTLPHCHPLELEAVIRNRRSLAYGIEFINLTAAQQASLKESIRSWRLALTTEEAS